MRDVTEFSFAEWLQLRPLVEGAKQLYNDAAQKKFLTKRPESLKIFLAEAGAFKGKNILQIIAFEQADILNLSVKMAKRHVTDATVLVFDNSRRIPARKEIENICRVQNVPYLALPENPSRHPNRSHGMAMTWIWQNVVSEIRPAISGFIDHDLIAIAKIELEKLLDCQPFYGVPMVGKHGWSLWAGCCFYNFTALEKWPLNFLNDFSRGLDTGGRNWNCIYKNHDRRKLKFADWRLFEATDFFKNVPRQVEIIDNCWFHIARVGHDEGYKRHSEFYNHIAKAIEDGADWARLQAVIGGNVQPASKEFVAKSKWPRWRKHHFEN